MEGGRQHQRQCSKKGGAELEGRMLEDMWKGTFLAA